MKNILIYLKIIQIKDNPNERGVKQFHSWKIKRFNPYNPLSYILILFAGIFVFVGAGINEIIEFGNPFKWSEK